jgi:hypothetical protein
MLYMVTFTIHIPQVLAYISAPWILWVLVSSLLEEIKHKTRKRPNARTEFVAQEFVPIYLQSGITYVGSDNRIGLQIELNLN